MDIASLSINWGNVYWMVSTFIVITVLYVVAKMLYKPWLKNNEASPEKVAMVSDGLWFSYKMAAGLLFLTGVLFAVLNPKFNSKDPDKKADNLQEEVEEVTMPTSKSMVDLNQKALTEKSKARKAKVKKEQEEDQDNFDKFIEDVLEESK